MGMADRLISGLLLGGMLGMLGLMVSANDYRGFVAGFCIGFGLGWVE